MNDEEFDKLICSFVKLFAMYEYKIKDLTYWTANNENTTFKIDWDKFINEKIFLNDQGKGEGVLEIPCQSDKILSRTDNGRIRI